MNSAHSETRRPRVGLVVWWLLGTAVFAEAGQAVHRVSFDTGQSSAMLTGSVVRGMRDHYIVTARAGQVMTVTITSSEKEGGAVFQIYQPRSKTATLPGAGEMDQTTRWTGQLSKSGDYVIAIGGVRGNAVYSLAVAIN